MLSLGVKVRHLEIDLATPTSACQVLSVAEDWLGLPDILVNNAAHSTRDGFERLDAVTLDAHYAVNMRTTFLLSVELANAGQGPRQNERSYHQHEFGTGLGTDAWGIGLYRN